MGCYASKLDDEESVQLCKDRRNFIKQAVEQRYRFALGHIAYIESLRRVSVSLLNFVEGNEHHDFFIDQYTTPPFTPLTKLSPEKNTTRVVNCLRPGNNPPIQVQERAESPETEHVESFCATNHYGIDGFFTYEASQLDQASSSSPYGRPSYPPTSLQNSQWDYFWNPFSSLDQSSYQISTNEDDDNEMINLRKVREEEGIPELEELSSIKEEEQDNGQVNDDEQENKKEDKSNSKPDEEFFFEAERKKEKVQESKECQSHGAQSIEVSEARDVVEGKEDAPGFTVYVNRRPSSMVEVIKDIETQFVRIFDSAREVSVMLEASKARFAASNELTGVKMLNPAALFRTPSSRSSSSRFLLTNITSSREDGDETSSNYSEECCMISGSHQTTLDRLYAWEKKLYEEVKCEERIRIAYEKKCMQLRNHDVNGAEHSIVDKTRAVIRDLRTQLKVAMHSVECVSRRIEALRDEELYPQLMELIQGLTRMWRTITDSHVLQKRTIDEAKLLLFASSSATTNSNDLNTPKIPESSSPSKPSRYATNFIFELRNWKSSFSAWINAQRSYARALARWISRCDKSPRHVGLCIVQWSKMLDSVSEVDVIEGIDFFITGINSVSMQRGIEEEGAFVMSERVLCAGISKVVGTLMEFSGRLGEGYEELVMTFEEGEREGRVEE